MKMLLSELGVCTGFLRFDCDVKSMAYGDPAKTHLYFRVNRLWGHSPLPKKTGCITTSVGAIKRLVFNVGLVGRRLDNKSSLD